MRFSLQEMVQQTLSAADELEKRAQAEEQAQAKGQPGEEKKDKRPPAETPPNNTATSPERNDESVEKTSSAFVQKLASAVEYLNANFLKQAQPETAVGPGVGAGALPLNTPTPGTQSENTGQARGGQPPMKPGSDSPSPGQTNTTTALETDMNTPPGGRESWENQGKLVQASARVRQVLRKHAGSSKVARVLSVLNKMAADSENPAQIKAQHTDNPPEATVAEQGVPAQPGEVSRQERLVDSNQAAIDYTKGQAKEVPKARMGEVLDEPAQRKATDPVLQQNLDAAAGAGTKLSSATKVAAARALLRKIAQEGESQDATPEEKERAAKLKAALEAKNGKKDEMVEEGGKEKESQMWGDRENMPLGGGY